MYSHISHILGWNLSFCCIMLIAWHDESLHSLLLSAWSRMRPFPIPAPGDPSGNTYVGPADCLIWPSPYEHTDKTAVLAGTNASACPQTVWGHMFCPHEGNILGLILVKSPLFPFFWEEGTFVLLLPTSIEN